MIQRSTNIMWNRSDEWTAGDMERSNSLLNRSYSLITVLSIEIGQHIHDNTGIKRKEDEQRFCVDFAERTKRKEKLTPWMDELHDELSLALFGQRNKQCPFVR